MEIQKIFSEVDTEEKLYSVLMTEEEYRLFSSKKMQELLEKAEDIPFVDQSGVLYNKKGVKANQVEKLVQKVKDNPKEAALIGAGTLAAAGLSYGGHKAYKHYKKNKSEKK